MLSSEEHVPLSGRQLRSHPPPTSSRTRLYRPAGLRGVSGTARGAEEASSSGEGARGEGYESRQCQSQQWEDSGGRLHDDRGGYRETEAWRKCLSSILAAGRRAD